MYAVIEAGGKQYRVEVGTELEIDRIDAAPGDAFAIERVLLVADGDTASIGRPTVANASVAAEVVRRERGEKLISFKYRPKARRRVKKGHRQELTLIRISDIVLDGRSAAGERAKADEARKTERQRLEDAARRQAEQDAALAAKLAKTKAAPAADESTTSASAKPAAAKRASGKAGAAAPKADGPKARASARPTTATKATETSTGGSTAEQTAAKPRRTRKAGGGEPAE
jgi:large subunit ribosomal protein L21